MLLGIDIGSATVAAVQLDQTGKVRETFYDFHEGQPARTLQEISSRMGTGMGTGIALTSSTHLRINGTESLDIQTALVRASRFPGGDHKHLLHVGAEKFYLIRKGSDGHYESSRTSSSCAAGTGSFLDQQCRRLRIQSIEEFCRMAENNAGDVPDIASRCSVFAKTDLIHAQQEGFSTDAICDGLCKGLARNLADTLFHDFRSGDQVLFTGGVSRNQVVAAYLEQLLEAKILGHPMSHLFGALGAGLRSLDAGEIPKVTLQNLIGHFGGSSGKRKYFYPALKPEPSAYPDFGLVHRQVLASGIAGFQEELLEEYFEKIGKPGPQGVYLGIDIGSTSTKAIISTENNLPLLGYYTYTSGKPIEAVFSILEAFERYMTRNLWQPEILGVGTTGSGRKLLGKILDADLILDEITAHARAASHLDPKIDTIIEIGGQDAKFTVLSQGEVVFSQMNTVCAAGTGSFIEEQARKLGVPLQEYASRVQTRQSPLTSNRCTVFMERDLNYLVNQGYEVGELLAAVLYSVRDNYFKKVAVEGMIGERVCFQGATAKNRALVNVFEQKLGKEIVVSKYCHLTGALGINLTLKEEGVKGSRFRGIPVYREKVPVRTEICDLCNNRCKLTIARVREEEVAFGFLCGRDYKTPGYKARKSPGFDLIKERKKAFAFPVPRVEKNGITLGIPAALHVFEESRFLEHFFALLGIRTITSHQEKTHLKEGKNLAGAEFCAPVESMYGHVRDLLDKADFIFLPVLLESRERTGAKERNYCYYTQFSPSIVTQMAGVERMERFIIPEMDFSRAPKVYKKALFRSLSGIFKDRLDYALISRAWDETENLFEGAQKAWKERFREAFSPGELSVVLLGRPYVVLSPELNKNIPEYFAQRGVKCFFQDMLPAGINSDRVTEEILRRVPWHFAATILGAAEYIARTPGLYPVLVTAFKCAPDSFIMEYFKKILDARKKPYLILQIDEHDSGLGYETRIEAALRSFRNHARNGRSREKINLPGIFPELDRKINNKTLLVPNWDNYSNRLLIAVLRRHGLDARLLEPDETSMRQSMAHNKGQCIPLNIIAQDFIDYVSKYGLEPSGTLLWMPTSYLTCNFRMYPEYLKHLLESHGNGLEKAGIYLGQITNLELSLTVAVQSYFVYMLGGFLRKMGCMIRPDERKPGETDLAIETSLRILEDAFSGRINLESGVRQVAHLFNQIAREENPGKPRVAIFGDFYVRDHDVVNQNMIRFIEEAGGVVVTTPYHDYVKLQSENVIHRAKKRGDYQSAALNRILLSLLDALDRRYYRHLESILGMKERVNPRNLEKHLDEFNVKPYHSGESYDNLLKIFQLLEYHPELSLFVQTNPAFCCPALITEAMTRQIKEITGVPVVTVTFDGTSESKNDIILPYLVAASERSR